MFDDNQLKTLKNELDRSRIKTREKGNINLSYLEGFDVIETANSIFGFGNWSYNVSKLDQVSQEQNQNQNYVVCYKAVVQVSVHNSEHTLEVHREDVGFGSGIAKTLADSHENGAKEAITDALKRCLRSFGNQFGNSLYDKTRNHNSTVQQNNTQPTQNNNYQNAYPHQQDFNQLTNLGLTVVQQGEYLIVVGDNVFANKDTIKAHGFRWDGSSKRWYMQLRQVA